MSKDNFAINEIKKYYEFKSKSKYYDCINQTFFNIENHRITFEELKTDDELENRIIKTLLSIFLDKLSCDNSDSGILGLSRAFFSDGFTWCYKDPIKKEFRYAKMIYAKSLWDLRMKVKEANGIWYIIDLEEFNAMELDKKNYKKWVKLVEDIGLDKENNRYNNLDKVLK